MAVKRKSSCLRVVGISGLAGLCLLVLVSVWALDALPGQIQNDFGQPAPTLSPIQSFFYGIQLLGVRQQLLEPANPEMGRLNFKVETNQPVVTIAQNLETAGIIRSASAFRLFLIYSGLDVGIKAGEYQLSPAQNSIEIARALQDSTPLEVTFRILPGWRLEEIAAALPSSGLQVSAEQFLSLAQKPHRALLPPTLENLKSLEGFLFPDTYRFKRDITAEDFVAALLKRFNEKVTAELRAGFQKQGLDLTQAVTLASMIQREGMVAEELPLIASVFYNRLKINMKLDSDPTVQYAVGYNPAQGTWWTNPLSSANLRINSPYNTYLVTGLPPTPISNPGLEALQAVAYPAKTPYFYFRAKCDGSYRHNFAISYEEHVKNGCP